MKCADLKLTIVAAELMRAVENRNSRPNPEVVECEEGSFNIEFSEDGNIVDEDCYIVDEDGGIYIVSTPMGRYYIGNVSNTLDQIDEAFEILEEKIYEKIYEKTLA